jgi:hypothetical protein
MHADDQPAVIDDGGPGRRRPAAGKRALIVTVGGVMYWAPPFVIVTLVTFRPR